MVNKILFIGSKSLGFSFLKKLESINYGKKIFVLTIDDSNDERSVLNDIINFSEERGLPTHVISKPSMLKSVLLEVNPDICFVVGWYWILPYDLIKSVKYGFLGFHASLLPKLRGFAPLVWAILNGEKKTGVTLFYFDEGVDSGDIVDQYGFEIGENDYIADLLKKTEAAIAELLKKNINEILAGQNNRTQQNNLHATFCSQRKPVDGLINWSENNVKVDRLIRATSIPYPCAFTYYKGKKLLIIKSSLVQNEYYGIPGLIVKVDDLGVIVTCGKGAVIITKVQFEEKTIIDANKVFKYGDRLAVN